MLKLLLTLAAAVVTAVCLVQLRQQRLEMTHDIDLLHNGIETRQSRLWNQQLTIAADTAPGSVRRSVGSHELKLSPVDPVGTTPTQWRDVAN